MRHVVVYASDGNDLELLRASLFSLKRAVPDAEAYVLSEHLSQEDVQGAKVLDPGPTLDSVGFFCNDWNRKWPYATLYRMAIPLMDEFKDVDRLLYLDTDTLVKTDGIKDLFEMGSLDFEILGAKDSNGTWKRVDRCVRGDLCVEGTAAILQRLWTTRQMQGHTYVNAGVTLWCLARIRENGIDWYRQRLKWFWEAETRCRFEFLDQDFINSMMLTGAMLPRKCNVFADAVPPGEEIVVKHFIAHTKREMLCEAKAMGYAPEAVSSPKVVVYSSDGRDSTRLRLSAMSVKKALGPNVKFYILTELAAYPGFSDATLVNPMQALKDLGFFSEGWRRTWPFSCLFRLALPLLDEFKDVDRLLYLDTDTLVRSRAVDRLFNLESGGYEAYGAQDIERRQWDIEKAMQNNLPREAAAEMRRRLWKPRTKDAQGYINSGVLVMFLETIRKNGLDWYRQRMKWFWEAVLQGRFGFPDQDFINLMMDVNPGLSVRFNRFAGDYNTNCIVQHFVGGSKSSMGQVARRMGI